MDQPENPPNPPDSTSDRYKFLEATQWKKGESGNPKGRPKGAKSITNTIVSLLEKEINLNAHPITGQPNVRLSVREIMVLAMLKKALRGDMEAIKTVLERVEGKVPFPMEHTGISLQLATMVEYINNPKKLLDSLVEVEPNENGHSG